MNLKSGILLFTFFSMILLNISPEGVQVQPQPITLTIAVNRALRDDIFASNGGELLRGFESAHPGVKVKVVIAEPTYKALFYTTPIEYFDIWQKYVNTADVMLVNSFFINPEVAHGGYLLDLKPYADNSKTLNETDFYPAVLQSFQFDGGLWGLPVSTGGIDALNYDPKAFDDAGLSYPTAKWTMADLTTAVRKLAEKDASNHVTRAGIDLDSGVEAFFYSLLGSSLVDETVIPNAPQIDRPDAVAFLNKWLSLQREGLIGPQRDPVNGNETDNAPLRIGKIYGGPNQLTSVPVLMPGNRAGISPEGYGVSGGTHYPELAYDLAEYLTTRPSDYYGPTDIPARISAVPLARATFVPSDRVQKKSFIDDAVKNAIPMSDLRYFDDLWFSLYNADSSKSLDTAIALHDAQVRAVANLQLAVAQRQKTILSVASTDVVQLAPGQREIRFGVVSNYSDLPNLTSWEQVIHDFTRADTSVKRINLMTTGNANLDDLTRKYDCFYLPTSAVPRAQNGQLISIDALSEVDKYFNRADIPSGVLAQLQYDNKLWAYPLTISLSLLRYDASRFAQAGLAEPSNWDFASFIDSLHALKATSPSPVFSFGTTGGSVILMLIAANGGLPIDFHTEPPLVNFTDPITVSAIRQVLDLAKQGLIDYHNLSELASGTPASNVPIYADNLAFAVPQKISKTTIKLIDFPRSRQAPILSYDVGAGYISPGAQNPEDCYRWFNTLTQHPELFSGVPARRSMISTSTLSTMQGTDEIAFYEKFLVQLDASGVIIIPSRDGMSYIDTILERELFVAFDQYVSHEGDLDSALVQSEQRAKGFLTCMNGNDVHSGDSYNQTLAHCVSVMSNTS